LEKSDDLQKKSLFLSVLYCWPRLRLPIPRGNREKSTVLLGLTPIGIHAATLGAPPVTIGLFGKKWLDAEWMVGLDMGSKSYSATSGTATATATYSYLELYGRYFL